MTPGRGNPSVPCETGDDGFTKQCLLALSDNLETVPKAIATIFFIILVTDRLQSIAHHLH